MQIKDYCKELLDILAGHPHVTSQNFNFDERPPQGAFISGSISFSNGSTLHFKEFVVVEAGKLFYLKYGYHYAGKTGRLIFRYDNALDPRAKNLPAYPGHKHTLRSILAAKRPSLKKILQEITAIIERNR